MGTSTANKGDETPYMCLTMKWKPSWMSIALTGGQLLALMSAKFLRSFFGDWYLQRFLSVVSV